MQKYKLVLSLDDLQRYRDALLTREEVQAQLGNELESFKCSQAIDDFDAQIERQGISIVPEEK